MTSDDERLRTLIRELKQAVAAGDDTTPLIQRYSLMERARGLMALFNDREYECMPELVPVDHVHDMRPFRLPDMGLFRGREEYARFIRDWTEAFPKAQLEPEFEFGITEPVEAGFGIVTQRVEGGGSEIPIEFRYAWIGEFSEERSESIFGSDPEEMRNLFRSRYGHDPGPFELEPLSSPARQEA